MEEGEDVIKERAFERKRCRLCGGDPGEEGLCPHCGCCSECCRCGEKV